MDNTLQATYPQHLQQITQRWAAALDAAGHDAAVVWAGHSTNYLFDDQAPPFRANPHLLQWFPYADCEHSALVVTPEAPPTLHFYQPNDYWHAPPNLPDWARGNFEVVRHTDPAMLQNAVNQQTAGVNALASIGAQELAAAAPGAEHNPAPLIAYLDYQRAVKTPFELECMRGANQAAVAGHLAAAEAFKAGSSEFDIQLAYLGAARQSAAQLPYGNIVALNEHAGVLHYQHQETQPPQPYLSLLIDAGASYYNYAADVTRTYAFASGAFAELIERLDHAQQQLLTQIRPGMLYTELHERMHTLLADVMIDAGLLSCSAEAAVSDGITRAFLPHGLGHLLGLQTHDVAGQQVDERGTQRAPAPEDPALRLTRELVPDQVFTIEPGLYFIPMLLEPLRGSPAGDDVNWEQIEALAPYGGIRIEDNVRVLAQGIENFTRDAFAAAC